MEEAATPFPSEETTPPVTKIYFGAILAVRGFKRGLIGPPQETYKELWMQLQKVSIGNAPKKQISGMEFMKLRNASGEGSQLRANNRVSGFDREYCRRKTSLEAGTFRRANGK